MRKELSENDIKFVRNEIRCMKLRIRQIENYRKKISEFLDGMSIEEADKAFPPIAFPNSQRIRKKYQTK